MQKMFRPRFKDRPWGEIFVKRSSAMIWRTLDRFFVIFGQYNLGHHRSGDGRVSSESVQYEINEAITLTGELRFKSLGRL